MTMQERLLRLPADGELHSGNELAAELELTRAAVWKHVRQLESLDRTRDLVVVCHHGIRSGQVCLWLARQGFDRVLNLAGGIDAWSVEVDPTVPRY